jgi:hypothetical protein
LAVPIVWTGSDKLANRGPQAMIDLLKSKVKNAGRVLRNTLADDVYSAGALTDQIGGLQYLVQDTPAGMVGGIDVSTNGWWKNQTISAALDLTNIGSNMLSMYTATKRNGDTIKAFYGDDITWSKYYNSLQAQQRFTDTDGRGGFKAGTVSFMGTIPVKCDGGIGGSCPAKHMYGLNTDYLFLRENKIRNKNRRGNVQAINQDVEVDMFMWAGAMTSSGRQFSGALIDTAS